MTTALDSRREAYEALDRAIELLMSEHIAAGRLPVDAVLVVGTQTLTEDGHVTGGSAMFLKGGVRPLYPAKGLLVDGLDGLRQSCSCGH